MIHFEFRQPFLLCIPLLSDMPAILPHSLRLLAQRSGLIYSPTIVQLCPISNHDKMIKKISSGSAVS